MRTLFKTLRRFLPAAALLLAVSGAIIACGGADNSGATTSGGSSSTASGATHFKVGDQVKVGSTWVVTVNSAALHGATDIDQPQAGNTYLILDITFKNVSSQEQDLSSIAQLSLKDATGQTYNETVTSFQTGTPDGKVEVGGLLRGQVVYEVPQSQHTFTLAFQASIVSSGQTIWDITVP